MSRSDYVKCVADTHQERIGLSLCGRVIGATKVVSRPVDTLGNGLLYELEPKEWVFTGLDHVYNNARQGGQLVVCASCARHAIEVLEASAAAGKPS